MLGRAAFFGDQVVAIFGYPFMTRALIAMAVLALASSVVGFFISLRDLEFVSDGLIHAVFPGLVVGFALAGSAGIIAGAFVAAVLAAVLLTYLMRRSVAGNDAAVAVVLTSLFSIGIVIVSKQENYVSQLEQLLFGRLLTVTDLQLIQIAVVATIAVALVLSTWRRQIFRAFDPVGFLASGNRLHSTELILNIAIAMLVVAGVQAIGNLMVLALLIVPMAFARLVTRRIWLLLPLAFVAPLVSSIFGLWLSFEISVNQQVSISAGALVVVSLLGCYLLALIWYLVRRMIRR